MFRTNAAPMGEYFAGTGEYFSGMGEYFSGVGEDPVATEPVSSDAAGIAYMAILGALLGFAFAGLSNSKQRLIPVAIGTGAGAVLAVATKAKVTWGPKTTTG